MRSTLKSLDKLRLIFLADISGFGKKQFKDHQSPTILLKNVRLLESGKCVTDHLWFGLGKSWEGFKAGDSVQFEARVKEYEKGYKGKRDVSNAPIRKDYKLERPTKIRLYRMSSS